MARKAGLGVIGVIFVVAMVALVSAEIGGATPVTPGRSQDYGPLTEDMVTDEMIATGGGMFNSGSCQRCHMQGGQGGGRGPALTDDEWLHSDGDLEGIRGTIVSGVAEDQFKAGDYPYPMYAMGGMELDEDGLNALAAYVWSLSQE
jgi:mono/diheme cytochrome c family protein